MQQPSHVVARHLIDVIQSLKLVSNAVFKLSREAAVVIVPFGILESHLDLLLTLRKHDKLVVSDRVSFFVGLKYLQQLLAIQFLDLCQLTFEVLASREQLPYFLQVCREGLTLDSLVRRIGLLEVSKPQLNLVICAHRDVAQAEVLADLFELANLQ